MKIAYIHGYKGSAYGTSFENIKEALGDDAELIGVEYDETDYYTSRESILEFIEKEKPDMLIGSSLGGFLTMTIPGIDKIVINPCVWPNVELPKLGASEEFVKTFFDNLEDRVYKDKQTYGIFGIDDEILGLKYFAEFMALWGVDSYLVNSGHQISKEGAKKIPVIIKRHFSK